MPYKNIKTILGKTHMTDEMKADLAEFLNAAAQGTNDIIYVGAGVNGAADITVTGVVAGDAVKYVIDLTTPAAKTTSHYTCGAGVVTQAAGAGDTSAKQLLIVVADLT